MTRRFVLSFVLLAGAAAASDRSTGVAGVESIGVTVSDLERSVDFYTRVLSFKKTGEREFDGEQWEHLYGVFGLRVRTARLQLGDEALDLMQFLAPEGRPLPADSRSNDRWFQHIAIIVSDLDRAYAQLRAHNIRYASSGPQRLPNWNKNAGGIGAFYFRDPDGHVLEILNFPEDKGDPKWHRKSDELFLGIDHTAVVISDTETSLRFYRDLLGLHVAGESENYGTEQEHLNNVFGARLRITALRGSSGPGIEFLEYLAPRDGRPYPGDAKPNDLVHWHTRLMGTSAESIAQSLRTSRAPFISSGVIEAPDANAGFRKAFLARDPDGHAVQFVEK
jgi:catechol 2,3-dioxygenase-like lactoylglutathione lyase family enzyme